MTAVSLRGTWVGDTDLRRLSQYSNLSVLDLSLTHITDQGMQEIKNLRGITDCNLYFAQYITGKAQQRSHQRLEKTKASEPPRHQGR